MAGEKGIDIPVEVTGASQGVQDLNSLHAAEQGVANTVEDAGNKAGGASGKVHELAKQKGLLAGAASRVGSSITSMVTSLLSVGSAIAIFHRLADALERIQRAQDKIAGKGIGTLEATQPLATQLGKFDTEGQLETAQLGIDFQRAGRFSSLPGAVNFAIAADVAFAGSGGLGNPQNVQTAKSLASVLGPQIGDDSEAGGAALELLNRAGRLGSAGEALLGLAQLRGGFTKSTFTDFGEFLNASLKGGTPLLAERGNLTDAIENIVRAREVVESGGKAGTALEQLVRVTRGEGENPAVRLLRAKAAERGQELGKLPFAERLDLLGELLVQGESDEKLRAELAVSFPPEIFGRIKSAFIPKTQETVDVALQAVGEASAQQARQLASDFAKTPLGKDRASEAEASQKDLEVARAQFEAARMRREAKGERERQEAIGSTRFVQTDTARERDILFSKLFEELGLTESQFGLDTTARYLNVPRSLSQRLGRELTGSERDAVRRALSATAGVNLADPFNDSSEDTRAIQKLEGIRVEINNGTINNYNGRDLTGTREATQRGGRR